MQNQYSKATGGKMLLAGWMALMMLIMSCQTALASTVDCHVTMKALKVYQQPSSSAKVLGTLKKGDEITVTGLSGQWARVKSSGNVGYVLKKGVKKSSKPASKQDQKVTVRQVQTRLAGKGYLKASAVTGSGNDATTKALRIFQMFNNLSINGKANKPTVNKLFSSGARKKININSATWSKSGINTVFRNRGLATVIDMGTGARFRIRRVGGHNHLDVEPKTKADTLKMKRVYGGTWSWDSRPILLITGGRAYASAMNGMPHGAEISKDNGFDGQFCIHLNDSLTHGTEKVNPLHQANIAKVVSYFK